LITGSNDFRDLLAEMWYQNISNFYAPQFEFKKSKKFSYVTAVNAFPYAVSGKSSAVEIRKHKNTVELRFFDMARSAEEMSAQVRFAQKLYFKVLEISKKGERIPLRMSLKMMRRKTYESSKKIIFDYIENLGLDPRDYCIFLPRMKKRFILDHHSKKKRFLT
jgi:hypothetical protein